MEILTSFPSGSNDAEFARLFFKRFLEENRWEIELARTHSASIWVVDEIRRLVEKSPHLTSEGTRFTFALIVQKVGLTLPPAPLSVPAFHLSRVGRIANLKNAVDGISACYLVDQKGLMTIIEIPSECRKHSSTETMEELSRRTRSICVYAGVDLARIFSCGDIARTFRKGVWLRPFDLKFDELVKDGYPEDLLNAVRDLCIDLSESSKGGTVVLQKANALESCKPFRDVKFNPCDLFGLTKGQQKAYAEMDGAIIVTTSGKMIGISQRLVYPEWGTGSPGGARHESASRYSGQHESVVFVVSSDGPISIFKQGSLWANWFEELKP